MTVKNMAHRILPLLTILMLLLNLLAPVGVAFAQDGSPPPDPSPTEEVASEVSTGESGPAAEEPVSEEEPPAPQPEQTDEVQTEPQPALEEMPAEDQAEDAPPTETQDEAAPVIEDELPNTEDVEPHPEGTSPEEEPVSEAPEENPVAEAVEALDEADAVLLDENGEPLSLASQEAADALVAPDPQFCPAGLSFGDIGCGAAHDNMADAIQDALDAAALGTSGTIYVEAGSFDGFSISGFTYGTSLTIQGNADNTGTTNFTTAVTVDTTNVFSSLNFFDLTFDAGVTVNGVEGDLAFEDVVATNASGTAILVSYHDGDVRLDTVTANDTDGTGIYFNTVTGNITLNHVTANNSGSVGIWVKDSTGALALNDVTANNSYSVGIWIHTFAGDVTLNNVTTNDNRFDGIQMNGVTEAVTLNHVTANDNGWNGIKLQTIGDTISLFDVTANGNSSDGILLHDVSGAVTLNHLTANNNGADGVDLENIGDTISLFDVTANGNGNSGVEIDQAIVPQNVTITCSTFTNNGDYGFNVDANTGDLYLNSVTTGGNPSGNIANNVTNVFLNQVDCNPHEGTPRDGEKVELDPDQPTTIILDRYPHSITFPPMNLAQCTGYAHALFYPNQLPGGMPEGDQFLRALDLRLDGCPIPAGAEFTISFAIPIAEQANDLAVLFWDGTDWVEVPGSLNAEGRYVVNWPQTGVFVLVTK